MEHWEEIELRQMRAQDALLLDPFLAVRSAGGHNGKDDATLKAVLDTRRYWVDLPDSGLFPKKARSVEVVRRIFTETYDNLFIEMTTVLVNNSMFSIHEHIPVHRTNHGERGRIGGYVNARNLVVRDSYLQDFEKRALIAIGTAQKKCLTPVPKKIRIPEPGTEDLPPLTDIMDPSYMGRPMTCNDHLYPDEDQ